MVRECALCRKSFARSQFSSRQYAKGVGVSRCSHCVESGAPFTVSVEAGASSVKPNGFCETCKVHMQPAQLAAHYAGAKHRKKEKRHPPKVENVSEEQGSSGGGGSICSDDAGVLTNEKQVVVILQKKKKHKK